MAGTKQGGKNAADTNRAKYGPDFYARIGSMGGSKITENTKHKGFGADHDRAVAAAKVGGTISRKLPLALREARAKAYTKTPDGQIWQALQ